MQRRIIEHGYVNNHHWELCNGSAAPYILFVDGEFYCSCDSKREAYEEIDEIE